MLTDACWFNAARNLSKLHTHCLIDYLNRNSPPNITHWWPTITSNWFLCWFLPMMLISTILRVTLWIIVHSVHWFVGIPFFIGIQFGCLLQCTQLSLKNIYEIFSQRVNNSSGFFLHLDLLCSIRKIFKQKQIVFSLLFLKFDSV